MSKFNSDLFGDDGSMPMVKTLVTVVVYALIFGIGITQLGVGEEIIPILYWVIIAGIMGILIAGSTGLREVFRSWSYSEALKHSGLKVGDKITVDGKDGNIKKFGITHTLIKFENEEKLVHNDKLVKGDIVIKEKAKEGKK